LAVEGSLRIPQLTHSFTTKWWCTYDLNSQVKKVREILENQESRQKMVDHNYEIAKRHYSYEFLRRRLDFLLTNFFGTAL